MNKIKIQTMTQFSFWTTIVVQIFMQQMNVRSILIYPATETERNKLKKEINKIKKGLNKLKKELNELKKELNKLKKNK